MTVQSKVGFYKQAKHMSGRVRAQVTCYSQRPFKQISSQRLPV